MKAKNGALSYQKMFGVEFVICRRGTHIDDEEDKKKMLFDKTDVAMECLCRCFEDEESESKIELTGPEEITFTLADRKETFKKVDGRWI